MKMTAHLARLKPCPIYIKFPLIGIITLLLLANSVEAGSASGALASSSSETPSQNSNAAATNYGKIQEQEEKKIPQVSTGQTVKPACQLPAGFEFCSGSRSACFDVPYVAGPSVTPPVGPKPEGASIVTRTCQPVFGGKVTYGPYAIPSAVYVGAGAEPALEVQRATALGKLVFPKITLHYGPLKYAVVTSPTTWWADGPNGQEIQGSSANGLIAYASPSGLRITPGDGSEPFDCPWTSTAQAAAGVCEYAFQKSSIEGTATWNGQPAFVAKATTLWKLRFTNNGSPYAFPSLPDTIEGLATSLTVPVVEIQSIVTDSR
jgi:hypothetical protein